MSREIIQSLFSLTGVGGLILANPKTRPYFFGIETVLDRTKQMLTQGVLQVIQNIPDTFDNFAFHFNANSVFVYKLAQGTVLIIMTSPELRINEFHQIMAKVKQLIATDPYNTIGILKSLMGSTSQSTTQPNAGISSTPSPAVAVSPSIAATYQIKDMLVQLNHLSKFTSGYLGKMVVINYWKASRPQTALLAEFEIDRQGQINHPKPNTGCSEEQHREIKAWTNAYIQRCQQVIRNFAEIVKQDCAQAQPIDLIL